VRFDVHAPADDPAVINPLDAAHCPLLVAQPKQIPAHDPDPFQKRIRIVLSGRESQ